ncbi:hypothetical protein [Flavobacterium soli]|uniref:hypothetical protein n=1 Tax=Flavobacterium soli TaxID=344881 RepID=UPI000401BAD2|nr:hypothetical protein [Flavobacterium soli]
MKLKILLILTVTFFQSKVFATAQYPDKIVYQGTEYSLQTNPLEKYFKKHPEKRPKGGVMSSACWRGYVATFEVLDGKLLIKKLEIEIRDKDKKNGYSWKNVLEETFPDTTERFTDWFSGLLILPHGKLINYVHLDYGSTFENYILLNIKNGAINKERNLSGEEFAELKAKKFAAYKTTNEYAEKKAELIEEGWEQDDLDRFIGSFIQEYISVGEN